MTKYLNVRHTVYATFELPDDICLFDMEDNNNPENAGKPGSWYVKWATLHYIDLDGEEQEIEMIPDSMNVKNPDDGDDAYEFTKDEDDETYNGPPEGEPLT